jgi:hypothetical protein
MHTRSDFENLKAKTRLAYLPTVVFISLSFPTFLLTLIPNHFNTPTIASSGYSPLHSTMNEFIYRDVPNLPSQNEVIAACAKNGDEVRQLTYLSKNRKFFIKYGFSVTRGEAKNQQYFYEKISSQRGTTFKIPEMYRAFRCLDW